MNLRRVVSLLFIACAASLGAAAPAHAQPAPLGALEAPLWLRYSQISPDGRQIAFAFEGNLFVVPAEGGAARLLVGNGRHSFHPVWSPDSRSIAYACDPSGNFDVFLVAAEGGPSRRLTTHSANELPLGFTADGREVLFSAQRMDVRTNAMFPSGAAGELYKVGIEGGRRPVQLLTTPAMSARFDKTGTRLLYEDWKGYESEWRKHHVSPVARDIWLWEASTGRHRQLTGFGGEDREPAWAPDGQSFYYLSEQSGSFNVWKMAIGGSAPAVPVQVTRFATHPVRFLSVADNGTLSFGWDGELYTLAPGAAAPARVAVRIGADMRASRIENMKLTRGATEIATSPDGQEIAFVVRGQVFVASAEFGDTRRISEPPFQMRSVSFSPDGKRLLFAGEREGHWNLYEASAAGARADSPYFFAAARVEVRTLLKNEHENFQPRYSPDGKQVAFLEDRVVLKVLDLASGASHVVLPGEFNYSYADGDLWFDWSPDGRSLLATFVDRNRWGSEVGLVDAAGKQPLLNLTQSGYEDEHPLWTRGGNSMIWLSDRSGLHGNGSGGNAQQDIFAMFFTQEAFDRFHLSPAEYALLKKQEDADQKAKAEKKAAVAKPGSAAAAAAASAASGAGDQRTASAREKAGLANEPVRLAEPVKIERANVENRVERLTQNSAVVKAAAMTPDGETLFYVTQASDRYELWSNRVRKKELKKFGDVPIGGPARRDDAKVDLVLDAKGENGFVLASGTILKFKVPKEMGEPKTEPVTFSAEMRLDRAAERLQMFNHVWRQTQQKLYVKDMGGVDWVGYGKAYARFLPYVADNHDFAELLSEMLGELNVSHTGSGYRPRDPAADATAALGIFADESYTGPGVKVAEVIEGGPFSNAKSGLKAGMVIEQIGGMAIGAGMEWDSPLANQAGKRLEVTVLEPASGRRFGEVVKPISRGEQSQLLYKRWVKSERETVDRLSNGQIGYVHVRGMDDASYRDAYSEVLGRQSGKKALIVDTRFNGGGNLHDELATLLAGKRYLEFLPRGQSLGWEPVGKWSQPSIVVMSESNYSDAHLFPWVYRKLGIGKLLGMPVAGTGTAVWWETLQDDTLFSGIPQVGFRDEQGNFMETARIDPDIRVANDPGLVATGRDQQIEAAVEALLKR